MKYGARLLLAIVVSTIAGCAYRTPAVHVPAHLAGAQNRLEVRVREDGGPASAETTRQVEAEVRAVFDVAPPRCDAQTTVHVAFHDERSILHSVRRDGIAILALAGTPLGQIFEWETADVELEMAGDCAFHGRGSATAAGGLYARARRRALARALDRALGVRGRDDRQ